MRRNERRDNILQQLQNPTADCGVSDIGVLTGVTYPRIPAPTVRRLVQSLRRQGHVITSVTCNHGIRGYRYEGLNAD